MASPKEAPIQNDGFTKRIFENVKAYTELAPELVEGIVHCVATSGLVTTDEDSREHTKGDIVTIYTDEQSGEVCAFNSILFRTPGEEHAVSEEHELFNVRGVYLAGAAVHMDYQHRGLYQRMNEQRISAALNLGLDLIFTSTQNPNVQAGIEATLDKMESQGRIEGYEVERILEPGRYPYCLYKDLPKNSRYSYDGLDYYRKDGRSDAYVLLYRLQNIGLK